MTARGPARAPALTPRPARCRVSGVRKTIAALAACALLGGCAPRFSGAVPRDPDRGGGWVVVGSDSRGQPAAWWCVDLVHPSILLVTCQPLELQLWEDPRGDGLPYPMPK